MRPTGMAVSSARFEAFRCLTHFERTGQLPYLDAAIENLRYAVTAADGADMASLADDLSMLSGALGMRHHATGRVDDIREAVRPRRMVGPASHREGRVHAG